MAEGLDDLRRETRIDTAALVTVSFESQDGEHKDQLHICAAENISEGGIKLITRRVLPVGTELPMTVNAGSRQVSITGEVKWCLEIDEAPTYFVGIKVLSVAAGEPQQWYALVESILTLKEG